MWSGISCQRSIEWNCSLKHDNYDSNFKHDKLFFAASHSRGTKPPCRGAKIALGQDKTKDIHNFKWQFPLFVLSQCDFCSFSKAVLYHNILHKGLFRACLHGGGGPQAGEVTSLGGVTRLSIWSLILIWSRLHDRWGDPPRRVTRSTRPGYPLSRGQILPCKRSRYGNPPSRGLIRDTSNSSKIHFGGGFASLLKETIESHSTEGCSKSSKWV